MRPRETRHVIRMSARLRWQGNWLPAMVSNISSHGLQMTLPDPPKPGTYVEVYIGAVHIVARIIWVTGQLCGLQSRETFDLGGLRGAGGPAEISLAGVSRERPLSPRRETRIEASTASSRRLGSLFQYATFLAIAAAAAWGLASEVYATLSAPMNAFHSALDPNTINKP